MAKYNNSMYKTDSSLGGSNMNFKIILCEDKNCIGQSYVVTLKYLYIQYG